MKKRAFVGFYFMVVVLSGCQRVAIYGRVENIFGKPLAGVSVAVEHSGFVGATNASGKYALDYAAGNFNLVFAKPGYTTMRQSFSIKDKIEYPVERVALIPIPSAPGIWWIGPEGLVRISTATAVRLTSEPQVVRSELPRFRYFMVPNHSAAPLAKAATLRFIDTMEDFMSLVKLDDAGTIGHATSQLTGAKKFECTGCLTDQRSKIGDEQLLVRSAKLSSGWYAWLPLEHIPHADAELHVPLIPKKLGYAFFLN